MSLSVDSLVNVQIQIGAKAIPGRDFGTMLILGSSGVIPANERIRFYASVTEISGDFATNSPEYKAALLYFSQKPSPRQLAIGCWDQSPTVATLTCGLISLEYQDIDAWKALAPFDFAIDVAGTEIDVSVTATEANALVDLTALASLLTTKIAGVTVTWNSKNFVFTTTATGTAATLGFLTPATTVVNDVSATLCGTQVTGAKLKQGADTETALDAVQAAMDKSASWYAVMFADVLTDEAVLEVASVIEAASPSRMFGWTTMSPDVLSTTVTNDIGTKMKAKMYRKSVGQYSSDTQYAIASYIARQITTNFMGNNTMITMKFKQEPGVAYEDLSTSQYNALKSRNMNVFALFDNDAAIILEGVQCDGSYTDEVFGCDWFQNYIQNTVFNIFYTSTTKVPATEQGMAILKAGVTRACEQAYTNGLLAERFWTGLDFGMLTEGSIVPHGYYVFSNPVSSLTPAERENRIPPVIQVAAMLSGAFHNASIIVTVIR